MTFFQMMGALVLVDDLMQLFGLGLLIQSKFVFYFTCVFVGIFLPLSLKLRFRKKLKL